MILEKKTFIGYRPFNKPSKELELTYFCGGSRLCSTYNSRIKINHIQLEIQAVYKTICLLLLLIPVCHHQPPLYATNYYMVFDIHLRIRLILKVQFYPN